jgi:hypothetical protein
MQFAAVHWSLMALSGQPNGTRVCPLSDKSGQSSALARDASVATIEFFWKEKFVFN